MDQKTLVMKFGGTSVGTAQAMRAAVDIVRAARAEWPRVVVVTSALSGVTNLLLETAGHAARGEPEGLDEAVARLRSLHAGLIDALVSDPIRQAQGLQELEWLVSEFSHLCGAIGVLGEATPRALDAVASLGERMSVRILAAALQASGVPAEFVEATRLIVTDDRYGDAHPDLQATTRRVKEGLEPLLAVGQVPVVTGFLAATPQGVTTTLGRGGSDYSAALLGACLQAGDVWIWTDVDGVMTTDPRIVPEARTIPALSYREVSELAYYGARVLHPKTIRPVIEAGIGLRVANTFNPDHPGTRILPPEVANGAAVQGRVKAVTAIHGLQLITIEGRGMLGVPGVAARSFAAVAATGTSVPLITQASSEQSICFAVPAAATAGVLAGLDEAFAAELARGDIDRVWATGEVVIVTAVGAGMRHTPGVAGQIFTALGERGVNVIAIAQGSSEVSISLVVSAEDGRAAVRALHKLIQE